MTRLVVGIISVDLSQVGGHRSHVSSLLGALALLDVEVRIFSLATSWSDRNSFSILGSRWRAPTTSFELAESFTYQHVGTWMSELGFQRYRSTRQLRKLTSSCDIIHVASGGPSWGWAALRTSKPVVLHYASRAKAERRFRREKISKVHRIRLALTTGMVTRVENHVLRRVDLVCPLTEQERVGLRGLGREPIVVPHAVDTALFRPSNLQKNDDVVAIGRWEDPRKDVEMLLVGYSAARAGGLQGRLVLIGPNSFPQRAEDLIDSLGIREHVEILRANSKQLAATLANASMMVVSSQQEGFGIHVIEAMAAGCPVISTRCGGPEEIIDDGRTGYLVDVGDSQALAQRMLVLSVDDSKRRSFAEAALLDLNDKYLYKNIAESLAGAYGGILGQTVSHMPPAPPSVDAS